MSGTVIFRFTAHAIDRYLTLIRPDVPQCKALAELYAVAPAAELLLAPSVLGDPVYAVPSPAMLWIAKHEGGEAVIVTVIRDPSEVTEQMREVRRVEAKAKQTRALATPKVREALHRVHSPPVDQAARDAKAAKRWCNVVGQWLHVERARIKLAADILAAERIETRGVARVRHALYAEAEAAAGW